jgi:MFS family permease
VRSGLWLLTIVAGELVGYGCFGWLADRFGRRPVFTAFTVILATGLLMRSPSSGRRSRAVQA